MGNAPSSHATSGGQSSSTAQPNNNGSSRSRSTSAATSSQPIPTAAALGGSGGLGSSAFHSGLTPPTSPPSPPPPSTPTLLPFAGHLTPQNPHALSHPQAHDYSKSSVTRLILDGKLAPFYRGLEDFEEDWTEEDIWRALSETRDKDVEDGVENSYTERVKEEKEGGSGMSSVTKKIGIQRSKQNRREEEKEERERREKQVYLNSLECPICFLNYPPNINTSRCCQQPVCTECFVQIKRSEPTITHIESEPACCPFCMETDFGVIYERPITPLSSLSNTALGTTPDPDASGFSQALSLSSEADLDVGPGMNPKMKETVRRKSVSSKAAEVVTIDEIRPDWETKLNAVKAAAARRASRRIVMRQVGDRLIPIGFTSARAPGTADFSMSLPQMQNDDSGSGSPRRSGRRRESNRERELEELMIMEAMRLSLVDHEDHQRKLADERRNSTTSQISQSPSPNPGGSAGPSTTSLTPQPNNGPIIHTSYASNLGSRRTSSATQQDKPSGTSKLLSKINNVRARANSAASSRGSGSGDYRSVSFAANPTTGGSRSNISSSIPTPVGSASASTTAFGNGSGSGNAATTSTSEPRPARATPISTTFASTTTTTSSGGSGLSPTSPAPVAVAPVTTLASSVAVQPGSPPTSAGLPRLSLDMPALTPSSTTPATATPKTTQRAGAPPLNRMESEMSEATVTGQDTYAQLDSDEE
ncbi:hypothetical protein CI109_100256 [Kwoniella shandongensis]|uniref:Uncharacterized protein n=1 Tax=Kwoniella shandongensis TaxID=1734106 RepID=A0A5M6BRJ2_9TREE|nr:uncharacterized protein CI109_006207 [Kwoniella shandongensis]KAA5525403.1 hypothetical protein CI109_006207 [Kwoniella shandongensis]